MGLFGGYGVPNRKRLPLVGKFAPVCAIYDDVAAAAVAAAAAATDPVAVAAVAAAVVDVVAAFVPTDVAYVICAKQEADYEFSLK